MQFSSGAYYTPMDREFHEGSSESPSLEKPIMTVDELGVTVPEKHPVTGGNILQNIDAAIRMGASKMQIVMSTPHTSPMGGRPKAYGKDVRESIRELARANNVMIEGVEMPTSSMNNLSGFDNQRGNISEQKRQQDLQEVKEAIKFVADIAGGGGVDVFSQEFQRNIVDSKWNQGGKWKGAFEAYEGEDHYATEYLVDQRTGQIMSEIKHSSDIFEPVFLTADRDREGVGVDGKPVHIKKGDYVTQDGRWIDPRDREQMLLRQPEWDAANKKFKIEKVPWNEIVQRTEEYNDRYGKQEGRALDPAEYAFKLQMQTRWMQSRGQSLYYTQRYEQELKQLNALKKSLDYYKKLEGSMPKDELWRVMREDPAVGRYIEYGSGEMMLPSEVIQQNIAQIEHSLKHVHEASTAADAQAVELQTTMDEGMMSLQKFAKQKAVESYAEAGIAALDETNLNPNIERPIHVGPELGWPTAYGGHPEEFIELIKNSRATMARRLQKERSISADEAKELAKKHISGCFDTSHLGMWLHHFKKKQGENDEQHVKRFNKWYMDMVDRMQQEGVIGSVQAVDSATAAHGHLPPGQGIFPVVEAVELLKSKGFTGFVVSEGHEEDQFGQGRILLQTWRAFGADIADSYFAAPRAPQWGNVADQYFGHVNPPPYVIGAYRPTDDWVFWSGVPLE